MHWDRKKKVINASDGVLMVHRETGVHPHLEWPMNSTQKYSAFPHRVPSACDAFQRQEPSTKEIALTLRRPRSLPDILQQHGQARPSTAKDVGTYTVGALCRQTWVESMKDTTTDAIYNHECIQRASTAKKIPFRYGKKIVKPRVIRKPLTRGGVVQKSFLTRPSRSRRGKKPRQGILEAIISRANALDRESAFKAVHAPIPQKIMYADHLKQQFKYKRN